LAERLLEFALASRSAAQAQAERAQAEWARAGRTQAERALEEPPESAPAARSWVAGLGATTRLCRTRSKCDKPPRKADSSDRMWDLQRGRRMEPPVPPRVWWLPPRAARGLWRLPPQSRVLSSRDLPGAALAGGAATPETRGRVAAPLPSPVKCSGASVVARQASHRGGGRLTVGWEFQRNLENDYAELLCALTI
jgi:hypothetical protein